MSEGYEILAKAKKNGLFLCKTSSKNAVPGCYLGGLPTLPERFDWPHTNLPGLPPVPLHFVAQVSLAALPIDVPLPEFPRTGTLFFFVDPVFGPSFEYTGNTAAVLYAPEDVFDVPERPMASTNLAELPQDDMSRHYRENPATYVLERWSIQFEPRVAYDAHLFLDPDFSDPDLEDQVAVLSINEVERLQNVLLDTMPNADDGGLHSMFAGPNSPGELDEGDISYHTEMIPLFAIKADFSLGLFLPSEWVVFWINPDQLIKGDFMSLNVAEGVG